MQAVQLELHASTRHALCAAGHAYIPEISSGDGDSLLLISADGLRQAALHARSAALDYTPAPTVCWGALVLLLGIVHVCFALWVARWRRGHWMYAGKLTQPP